MSIIVYHGGTPFSTDFKRPFAAANGGSTGYYVTTDKDFASSYGPVFTYQFEMQADMSHAKLGNVEAHKLSEATGYWENYGENPDNQAAIDALLQGTVYDALMECINATGEIDKAIQYITGIGYNYASQPHVGVYIVIGGLIPITEIHQSSK